MESITKIISQFDIAGTVKEYEEVKTGNVNDTFIVTLDSEVIGPTKFVLQRINTFVFTSPEAVVDNMLVLASHFRKSKTNSANNRWEIPEIIRCKNENSVLEEPPGEFWRMITYIENSMTYQKIESGFQAEETGYSLGCFHTLTTDIDTADLKDTLPGFHITPLYLKQYDQVLNYGKSVNFRAEKTYCRNFIEKRRKLVRVLEDAKNKGTISNRIIHGDPKVNNFVFERNTGKAIGIIDLDTVKPGLILFDLGDCIRSCCNPAGEETENLDNVDFKVDYARALIKGYYCIAGRKLRPAEKNLLILAIKLMTFELGLRFFTDFLMGDVYFKTKHKAHNLLRAMVQFKLTEKIESKETQFQKSIEEIFK